MSLTNYNVPLAVLTCMFLLGACVCIEDVSHYQLEGEFTSQVGQILHRVRLNQSEIHNITHLYDDLYHVLGDVWPGMKIVPFGSVASGLGFKLSDVDCFVVIPRPHPSPSAISQRTYDTLIQYPDQFTNIEVNSHRKVPKVSFFHTPTKRYCDLTFSGGSAVNNTRLVHYLLGLDQRAMDLALLIKYWSKVHRVTGHKKLKSYGLTMQVVFFLQQRGILPSVFELQKNVPITLDDSWNTAFAEIAYESRKNETLYQLLGGFYEYYSQFNFEELIIAPFLGRVVERRDFNNLYSVPSEYVLYKHDTLHSITPALPISAPMCVQDPFDHNINIANITTRLTKRIISLYKYAAKMFSVESSESFLTSILIYNQSLLETDDAVLR